MPITSLYFAGFMVITLGIYYFLPRRAQNVWLLLASYVFYITWDWRFAVILLVLTVVDYSLAHRLAAAGRGRWRWLWLGVVFNLLALVFFKCANFFLPGLQSLLARLDVQVQTSGLQVLLPVGMSFYVLGAISYLIDVDRKQVAPSREIVDFALYMVYFPKLLAGPIERARSFLPKLAHPRVVDNQVLAKSFMLVVLGLVRKLVIADPLMAMIPANIFRNPQEYNAIGLWVWLFAYAFSLYFDFAGYTDIVRGVSGFLGIELSPNFKNPYFSRNFVEFWNRWHITLSHWLRDYIYFPTTRFFKLSKPKENVALALVVPPLVTMLASGFWHGASWNLLFWGGLHGIYQVIERLPSLWGPVIPPQERPKWRQAMAILVVLILTMLAWVPFRMELPVALAYWRQLFTWTNFAIPNLRLVFLLLLAAGFDGFQYFSKDELFVLRWPRLAQATVLALAVLTIFLVSRADTGVPFVYQGF